MKILSNTQPSHRKFGIFKCERMPFGLCNAPATFQRLMQSCLGELNLTYCLIYLDDVIIYTKDEEEYLNRLRTIFERFRRDNLKLKPSKYNLFQKEITFLAHDVSAEGIRPSKAGIKAVAEFLEPTNYTQIRAFLDLVGHYHTPTWKERVPPKRKKLVPYH